MAVYSLSKRSTPFLIVFLTLLGAALRLWALGDQSLWLDEVFTARVASLDVTGILAAVRSDLDTPPLHPLLVHVFLGLGDSDFVLRLPSAMAAIAAVPLMYVLGRRLLGETTGILAATLMTFSPYAVYYAQEARMYALVLMLSLLTFYCLERALLPSSRPSLRIGREAGWWLGFVLSATLGIYTHFFAFFVLGLAILYASLRLAQVWRVGEPETARRSAARLLLGLVAIGILFSPWIPVLLNFVRENYAPNPYGQGWRANLSLKTAVSMLSTMTAGYWAHPVVRIASLSLFGLGWLLMARRRPPAAALVALTVSVPFAVIAALNPGHFMTERYFIFMLPMLLLGMAQVFCELADLARAMARQTGRVVASSRAVAPVVAVFLLIPVLSASGLERYYREPPKPAWRPLARYIAGTVPYGDLIVIATFPHWDKEPLQHYLKMGGRRVLYAAEERELRRKLAEEERHPWWIVYAGTTRRLGRYLSTDVGPQFTVIPFDYLAVVRRAGDQPDPVEDGRIILRALRPRIPGPYQGEVQRVLTGLSSANGIMGVPIPPPVPTTVK